MLLMNQIANSINIDINDNNDAIMPKKLFIPIGSINQRLLLRFFPLLLMYNSAVVSLYI